MKNLHIISLGCARNLVDSEIILGSMQAKGYNISDEAKNSEVIVVNTCGFIDQAKQESVDTILEAAQFKEKGSCEKLVVVGCLSERYSEELQESIPEIDLIMGSSSFPHVADEVEKLYLANSSSEAEDKIVIHQERLKDFDLPRVNSLGKQSAYLKVAEGCAKRCSFCVIPQLRGKLRSRSIASLSKEAMSLVGQGVRELNLIAQDLTDYGLDRQDGASLAKLIDSLTAISDLRWLRLFYAYPDQLNDEVIDRIASQEKICRYLDIPVQHISNKILC